MSDEEGETRGGVWAERADEETEEGQHTEVTEMKQWKDGSGSRINETTWHWSTSNSWLNKKIPHDRGAINIFYLINVK